MTTEEALRPLRLALDRCVSLGDTLAAHGIAWPEADDAAAWRAQIDALGPEPSEGAVAELLLRYARAHRTDSEPVIEP